MGNTIRKNFTKDIIRFFNPLISLRAYKQIEMLKNVYLPARKISVRYEVGLLAGTGHNYANTFGLVYRCHVQTRLGLLNMFVPVLSTF